MPRIRNVLLALFLCVTLPLSPASVAEVDVSGTYLSKYWSNTRSTGRPVVILAQEGDKVTGQFNPDNGEIFEGSIEDGVIEFVWWQPNFGYDRKGRLKILDNGNRIEGDWYQGSGGNAKGQWVFIKDRGEMPSDLYSNSTVMRIEAKLDALDLDAPKMPLSEFAQFQLAGMTVAESIKDKYAYADKVREFEGKLTSNITSILNQWNAHGEQGTGKLLVKPHLHGFKMVSKETREAAEAVTPIISGLAGNSLIDLELVLVDTRDDKEISRVRIQRDTGDMVQTESVSLTSLSVYDQLVIDYVAAIAYEYLVENNELTELAASSVSASGNVLSEDTDQVPAEFIGIAAMEVASKNYDESLWSESFELAKGDAEKQSGIYIQLRSRQLANQNQTGKNEPSEKRDLTGNYRSRITGAHKRKIDLEVTQNANEIYAASASKKWEIEGKIEGDTVNFVWYGPGDSGKGKFTIDSDGNLMGKYTGQWGRGEWTLTKSE